MGPGPKAVGRIWEPQGRQNLCLEKYQPLGFRVLALGLGGHGVVAQRRRRGEAEQEWTLWNSVGLGHPRKRIFPECWFRKLTRCLGLWKETPPSSPKQS